jgi:hypothetical protein
LFLQTLKGKAQDLVEQKTLREAMRLELKLEDGVTAVTSLDLLKTYYSTMSGKEAIANMYSCGIGTWEVGSMGWKTDMTNILLEEMGWEYDAITQDKGKNNLANGIFL